MSSLKCLFDDVTSGFYYGSDGLRSPLKCTWVLHWLADWDLFFPDLASEPIGGLSL